MQLYLEQREYIGQMQDAAGARILVHDQNVMPFPEDGGISVSTGQRTSIGINRVGFSS